jgi:hypothetical protein
VDVPDRSVPALTDAEPLAYFSVTPERIESSELDTVTVRFSVDETFTSGDEAAVSLWRYDGTAWQRLETTALGNGSYAAETPGFSTFAVSRPLTATPTATATATATTGSPVDESQTDQTSPTVSTSTDESALAGASDVATGTSSESAGVTGGPSGLLLVLFVLGPLVVALSAYQFLRRD